MKQRQITVVSAGLCYDGKNKGEIFYISIFYLGTWITITIHVEEWGSEKKKNTKTSAGKTT